jgi:hypothetical protein
MNLSNILGEIDDRIAKLQQAKALLTNSFRPRKVGRPAKGVTLKAVAVGRKPLSAEAKTRIAAAQKKRWAKARRAVRVAAKKTTPVPAKKALTKKTAVLAKGVTAKPA